MFLDQATISVTGGKGGNGCIGWRREKYIPMGGPNGGDGGKGGDVIIVADPNADTLSDFAARKRFAAEHGEQGMGQDCHGHNGEDLVLLVPAGSVVTDVTSGIELADLKMAGDRMVIAHGGRGGFGNAHFKSSVRRAPDFAEKGDPGEHRTIALELKLVADVGIIGYPSTGKSTLISVVSSARPKIAAYPFTTIVPNLGVVSVSRRRFVMCDVPGLIEGASEGKGLGDQFLKHIERCGILVHLLDLSRALQQDGSIDPEPLIHDYRAIRHELEAYSDVLLRKKELVVINKTDLTLSSLNPVIAALKKQKITVAATISAVTNQGTDALMKKLLPLVLKEREKRPELAPPTEATIPVLRPGDLSENMKDYTVADNDTGDVLIRGRRLEQFTRMTNFQSDGSLLRFKDVLKKIGLLGLVKRSCESSKKVFIGAQRIDQFFE